jgi:hypothetical protein
MGEKKECITVLVGKSEERRPLGRSDSCGRLQDIQKWILEKLEGFDWIDLAQDRKALSTVTNLNLP